ncbi:MAG: NRDE family protein [Deltaproteobacteria bacterium]|nr:NRDE family protein [Deltaproteobacteria bacterium]
MDTRLGLRFGPKASGKAAMCTLHLFFQIFSEAPVLFAATRDELLDRPWDPPALLAEAPRIYGPRDASAGGTWLGVNEDGVLVSLANHEGTLAGVVGPSLCSRGMLVLDALRRRSAAEAAAFSEGAAPACKSYTLVIADRRDAFIVDRTPRGSRRYALAPGCHVVTNARFRDPDDAKAARCQRRMEALASRGRVPSDRDLAELLSDHDTDSPAVRPLCIHPDGPPGFGTSSASVVEIDDDGLVTRFLFAAGPPCTASLRDVTPVLRRRGRARQSNAAQEP